MYVLCHNNKAIIILVQHLLYLPYFHLGTPQFAEIQSFYQQCRWNRNDQINTVGEWLWKQKKEFLYFKKYEKGAKVILG